MKKSIVAVLGLLIMAFAAVCSAETYQMTYEAQNFTEKLGNDQALSETFSTPHGILKIQAENFGSRVAIIVCIL